MDYDVIIIGAGMSGVAAGIRLAHYDKRVAIVEQHALAGGLNSFYRRKGRWIDVGLHAVTNRCDPADKRAPLNRLLRQLRLRREDLGICEQRFSQITFPGRRLRFSNSFATFSDEVAREFPSEASGFRDLVALIEATDSLALDAEYISARETVRRYICSPILRNMIFCPVMYYGNACEDDMDFNQFCIMFQALFLEGFWRPYGGMRHIVSLLTKRFRACGGELFMRSPVVEITASDGRASGVVLADGTRLRGRAVLSCAGYAETLRLCDSSVNVVEDLPVGALGYVETIFVLDDSPEALGVNASITFDCVDETFSYRSPSSPIDHSSSVVCAPGCFDGMAGGLGEKQVRVTRLANPQFWLTADDTVYTAAKRDAIARECAVLEEHYPGIGGHILDIDMFTPKTIHRYTGHINGSVYGSPQKHRDGRTPLPGLYICGTDQGFLGIVGAMLSGVSIANLHLLV